MNINFKNMPFKTIIIILGLVPSFVGVVEIYDRIINKYFTEAEFNINRISINGHYFNYETNNLIGGIKRNQFPENVKYKRPSAQISITILNPTNSELLFKGFSLYVETFKSKKAFSFPTYFILSDKINPLQQFNTNVFLPSKSSYDIEFDVLVIEDRKIIFSDCASRFVVSFSDQNNKNYSLEKIFTKPTCSISSQIIAAHKLSSPHLEKVNIYGQGYGYNPFLSR